MRQQGTHTGVHLREPVDAVLRIGCKDPDRGHPIDRDRFYIVLPRQDNSGSRPNHPGFQAFNRAAQERPEACRTINVHLVHSRVRDAFSHRRQCQKNPQGESPPGRRPWCIGDGETAERWGTEDAPEGYAEIVCPGDLCPFAQERGGKAPPCKPRFTLFFRPDWPERAAHLPAPLMKLTSSGAKTSYPAILGTWHQIALQAASLGIIPEAPDPEVAESGWRLLVEYEDRVSLTGIGLTVTLSEETNPEARTRYPVLSFSIRSDLVEHFLRQQQVRQQLAAPDAPEPKLLPVGAGELTPDDAYEDVVDIEPGPPRLPGMEDDR